MMASGQGRLEKRADLFENLAEALYDPPDWLAGPGGSWPLTSAAASLVSAGWPAADVLDALTRIPPEEPAARRERYRRLTAGGGRPPLSLTASLHRQGRLLTEETAAVEHFYRAAGLEVFGAEMPDHASVELAFIGFLCRRQHEDPSSGRLWRTAERRFIKAHAGPWLVDLGRAMDRSGDPVYAPIGRLLAAALTSVPRPAGPAGSRPVEWPVLRQAADCILCSFCVQACPTGALAIDETAEETRLVLTGQACVGCGRCQPPCPTRTLHLEPPGDRPATIPQTLIRSPRLLCRGCGHPSVSEAEMNFVIDQIGGAPWLAFCPDCRTA